MFYLFHWAFLPDGWIYNIRTSPLNLQLTTIETRWEHICCCQTEIWSMTVLYYVFPGSCMWLWNLCHLRASGEMTPTLLKTVCHSVCCSVYYLLSNSSLINPSVPEWNDEGVVLWSFDFTFAGYSSAPAGYSCQNLPKTAVHLSSRQAGVQNQVNSY